MALLDDLNNSEQLRPQLRSKCTVCRLLAELDPAEAEKLEQVLQDPEVPKAGVSRVLKANGFDLRPNTLTRHARGECLGVAI